MRFIHKTAVALVVISLLVGAVAAAPSVDTETTDSATQTELTDGDTVSNFNASDTAQLSTLSVSYDSDNPGIKVIDPDTGATIEYFKNSSDSSYFSVYDATNNSYNTTFNESDFAAVPMEAEENKSVTLRLIGNTTKSSPNKTNITLHLNNTDERAVVYAADEVTGDDAPTGSATTAEFDEDVTAFGVETLASIPGIDSHDVFSVDGESVGVNGSDTDIYVVYASDNASTAFSDAQDRKAWGSYEDGDWVKTYQLSVEDTNYPVYLDEAPDEEPDGTYGVTSSVGPSDTDAIKVELGDDAEDETAVDVSSTANDAYGFLAAQGIRLRSWGLSLGLVLIVGGTVGVRRRSDSEE